MLAPPATAVIPTKTSPVARPTQTARTLVTGSVVLMTHHIDVLEGIILCLLDRLFVEESEGHLSTIHTAQRRNFWVLSWMLLP